MRLPSHSRRTIAWCLGCLLAGGCGAPAPPRTYLLVVVSPDRLSLLAGEVQVLTATWTRDDLAMVPLAGQATWTSSDPAVASVDAAGLVRAVSIGTAIVTAQAPDGGPAGTATVEVRVPRLAALAITLSASSLPAGRTAQLAAQGLLETGQVVSFPRPVTWSTSAPGIATVTPDGLVQGVVPGSADVRATDPVTGLEARATVTVTTAVLEALSVSPPQASVARGLAAQLEATGMFSDGTSSPLTAELVWTSSAPDRATVDGAGLVEAIASGRVTVTAHHASSGLEAAATVTVTEAVLDHLALEPTSLAIPRGLTQRLVVSGVATDGSTGPLPGGLAWSSSAPGVALVDPMGLVAGLEQGTAEVLVQHLPSGLSAAATVGVGPAAIAAVTISPDPLRICLGYNLSRYPTVVVRYTDGGGIGISPVQLVLPGAPTPVWSVSPPGLLSIDSTGHPTGLAHGAGTLTVAAGADGPSASCAVEVVVNFPESLVVQPVESTLRVGSRLSMMPSLRSYCGGVGILLGGVAYTTTDASVATVASNGEVKALSPGTATIGATHGTSGLAATATVTVIP